jgi:hypothetical protein
MVEKSNLNNGEHTLIPVTAKMILSTVFKCKRLVLKDGCALGLLADLKETRKVL